MINLKKSRKIVELALSFWIGFGLMSVITAWKISMNYDALRYSWIMFGVSAVLIIVCLAILVYKKK